MGKPKIRFDGYSEDWEQRKLEDLTKELSDYATMASGLPLLTSSRSGLMYQSDFRDRKTTTSNETLFSIVPKGSCTYRHMSDDDIFHLNINVLEKGLVSREYPVFISSENNDLEFIIQYINSSDRFRAFCKGQKKGGTRTRLYYKTLCEFEMMIPSIEEQKKISATLHNLDHLITLHQRKCDETKTLKKYMLQKMFPQNGEKVPEIRFDGFTEDWEQRKLGDSCKLNGRIGFRGYTEKDIVTKEAGGVLTFSPTNIVDNKLTMECKNTYITREKYDESPEIKISNGDILFVKTGSTLGKSALVIGLKEDASINPQIVVMRVEKDTETFMSNVLITDGVMKQVAAVKIGGAVPTMTETELKNFTYFAPAEKEEKKKIGNYFRTLDHLITLHQRKCNELKEIKKYMLQNMFV